MRTLESAEAIIKTVFNDLVARYKELQERGQWFENQPRLVVVGQSDARPDELYQALFGPAVGTAQYQGETGGWEVLATYDVEDVPGLGTIGAEGSEERALTYLREADAVILCTLRDRRPTEVELALYDHLRRLRRINSVVANTPLGDGEPEPPRKDPEAEAAWTTWDLELKRVLTDNGVPTFQVRRLASRDLVKLARSTHDRLPDALKLKYASLIRHHGARNALVIDMINRSSGTAAFFGLNPIPYADMLAITPVQVLLVCSVAAAYGKRIRPRVATDFIATCAGVLGAGWAFKLVYRGIKNGLGEPSLPTQMALGAAVAWVGTEVIGHAARLYFQSGGGLSARDAARKAQQIVGEQSLLGLLLG